MLGCYRQRFEITNLNLNMCREYQSEEIFINFIYDFQTSDVMKL